MNFNKAAIEEGVIGGCVGGVIVCIALIGLRYGVDAAGIMTLVGTILGASVTVGLTIAASRRTASQNRDEEVRTINEEIDAYDQVWRDIDLALGDQALSNTAQMALYAMLINGRAFWEMALSEASTLRFTERAAIRNLIHRIETYEDLASTPCPKSMKIEEYNNACGRAVDKLGKAMYEVHRVLRLG